MLRWHPDRVSLPTVQPASVRNSISASVSVRRCLSPWGHFWSASCWFSHSPHLMSLKIPHQMSEHWSCELMKIQAFSEICPNEHFNEACVIKCFLNLVKWSSDVWEQLGDTHRFHENLMLFHFFTFDSLVQLKTLLKLMWNDSPSSRPYPHLQSCQRCIVLYVHAMRSFIIFVSPTTLLPRSLSTPNTPPQPPPLQSCLHTLLLQIFFLLPSDIRVICWQMAAPGCATTTGGVCWIRTCGTAFASQDGEAWAATWPPKCSAQMAKTTRGVGRRKCLVQIAS